MNHRFARFDLVLLLAVLLGMGMSGCSGDSGGPLPAAQRDIAPQRWQDVKTHLRFGGAASNLTLIARYIAEGMQKRLGDDVLWSMYGGRGFASYVNVVALGKGEVDFALTTPPVAKVGSISATITFETKAVTFLKAEEGFLLDGVNADFEADLQQDADDPNKSILRLEVATEGDERKALREGLILSLIFRVNDDAADGTVVPLVLEQIAAKGIETPPSTIEPLVSQDGTIEVILEDALPYVGCFFFTH